MIEDRENMQPDGLFSLLDASGISYSVRVTSRGSSYAGFQLVDDQGKSGQFTILPENRVLKLTSHGVSLPGDPEMLLSMAELLPLGTLFISPETGDVELSVSFFYGSDLPDQHNFMKLLHFLVESRRALERGRGYPRHLPEISGLGDLAGADIATTLQQYGHKTHAIDRGSVVKFPLNGDLYCEVTIYEDKNGWMCADAHCFPGLTAEVSEESRALLQRLQNWSTSGRYRMDSGYLTCEVRTPLLAKNRAEIITWTASQAVVLMQTAARHYKYL